MESMQLINRKPTSHITVEQKSITLKAQQSSNTESSQLSLINPDLSGLHDTIYFKQGKTSLSIKIGSILNCAAFTHTFVLGIPIFIVTAYFVNFGEGLYWMFSVIVALIIIYPYVFPRPPWYAFAKWMNEYLAHYFDGGITTSFTVNRSSNQSEGEILCAHPHGILTCGVTFTVFSTVARANFESDDANAYSKLSKKHLPPVAGLEPKLYNTPIFKYFVQWSNAMISVAKKNVRSLMKENKSLSIFPGGFYEIAEYQYGKEIAVVPKGFIKYALEYGYKITPCYCFGASKTYYQFIGGDGKSCGFIQKIKDYLSKKRLPFILFWGEWYDPLLPKSNIGLHTIIGPSIQCPKINNRPITTDDIETYQSIYIDAIQNLFNTNKWRFGMDQAKLVVKCL